MSALDDAGSTMSPEEFAELVKKASNDELKQVMQSERRTAVLDGIFARMPGTFRPDRAGSVNAVIHWIIGDRPDGGADTYELVIANGTCELSPKPEHEPKVALNIGALDFLKVVSGNGNPVMLFMTGKLKAKGDLGLAANIANYFDIPKA
jgi:SCP-2 sterol transfer family protein